MNNSELKDHFEEFLSTYDEDNRNQIWTNQSKEFREFWHEKIMNSDYEELNDQEVDDIVRILDTHGKGNTPNSESIARVMIPQGAWRRLFNQLHENQSLSKAMESIFKASSHDEKDIYED